MGFIDWAADKVQSFSGEKDRRAAVAKIDTETEDVKVIVAEGVDELNALSRDFNDQVILLNTLRKTAIAQIVSEMHRQLSRFGQLKLPGEFVPETHEIQMFNIPEKKIQTAESYLLQNKWDEKERFNFAFDNGILGTKRKTEKLVYDLENHLGQLKAFRKELENEFILGKQKALLEIAVAEGYIEIIDVIISEIEKEILPKLSIIESFMIARHVATYEDNLEEAIKNPVIYSAEALRGTEFDDYGVFIRNAFGFYVLSANVLANPVLTNLLEDETNEADLKSLEEQQAAVNHQVAQLAI